MIKSIFSKSLFIFFTFLSIVAFAQVPGNDACAGATPLTLGNPCVNGTTVGSADNISTTAGCQSGGNQNNHNDVWYSFVSTGTQFTATVTTSAPFAGNVEFILVAGACGTQTIVNSICGASPLAVTINGLTAGTTYYAIISKQGSGTDGPFTLCNYATTTPTSSCTSNEDCATAQTITLNAVDGGSLCTTGCNVGAGPGLDFVGNNCYDTPNATVWYSFTTGATVATINVSLTSTVMTNPEFTIFSNTSGCLGPYTILSCLEGTGGSAVTNSIIVTPNTTYYVTVSDATGDEGNFNLCIAQNADNSACNTNNNLVVSATSMGSPLAGPYKPGEVVSFCYTITDWQQINCNYLGAVVPSFGPCWDPASFNAQGMPVSITTPLNVNGVIQPCPPGPPCNYGACAGTPSGSWNWFPSGSATYNVSGGSLPLGSAMGAGWYFLSSYNPATGACTGGDPTDPDNSFGDGNFPACGTNTFDYTLCFNLIAGPTGNCTSGLTNCGVTLKTYADGEFGAWASVGCMVDIPTVSTATLECCAQPNMTSANTATICSGQTVSIPLTSDVTSTYSWIAAANTNVTGESTTAQSTSTISNVLTNTTAVAQTVIYTVTPTSTTSCSGTPQTITVTINPIPTSTASTTGTLTCSSTSVALNSTLAGMNYTWTAPAGGSVGSANTQTTSASAAAGVYTLNIQSAAGCTYSTITTVTQNTTTPAVTASNTTTLTCTTTTAALTGGPATGVTYQWSGTGLSGSTTNQNATATTAGTYTLVVTSTVNSCTASATAVVSQNTVAPTGVNAGSNQTLGCGSASVVTLSGSATTPTNVTASWSGPSISGSTTNFTTTANGAGTYTLTATNPANGCTSTSTVLVNPSAGSPALTVNPIANTITCTNTLVTVSISSTVSPATYTWSGTGITSGNGTGTITVSQGGTFNYTLTNTTNSCSASGSTVVVSNTTAPTTTASTSGTLTCSSTTVALNSTLAGMNYTWTAPAGGSVGSANTQTTTASGIAGTYTLNVVNPTNGCTFTTTAAVTQNTTAPAVTASNTTTLTCATTTAALTGGPATGVTYQWSGTGLTGSTTNQNATATTAGTYTLVVTSTANSCTASATAAVTQNTTAPAVTASNTTTLTCTTTTAALTGGPASGVTYQWSGTGLTGSATNQNATATTAGTYTLVVTSTVNSCTASATAAVTQNTTAPAVTASNTATLTCATTTAALTGGPATGVTYQWSGTGLTGSTTNQNATATTAGTYTLVVTSTANSCTASATAAVTQNTTAPAVTASNTTTLTCATTTATLTGGPATGVTYQWSGTGLTGSTTNQNATATAAGTYTLLVTDAVNSCTASATTAVAQNTTAPAVSASNTTTLTCTTTTAVLTGGPATGVTYQWSGTGLTGSTTNQNATATATGIYTLLVTDVVNSCTASASTTVSDNTVVPTGVSAGSNQTLTCSSSSVTLNGSVTTPTNATVNWTGAIVCGTATNYTTEACSPGVYTLTATDPTNGCTTTSTVEVFANAGAPTVTISSTALVIDCNNASQSVTVTSTPNTDVTYTWNNAPATTSTDGSVATFTNANTYICTVTNTLSNCSTPVQVVVTTNTAVPTITITGTQTLTCATPTAAISLTTTPTSGLTYTWSGTVVSGQGTDVIIVNTADVYTVTVTNAANGCTNTAVAQVDAGANVPVATISVTSTNSMITCQSTSVTLTASVTPAGTYSYTWSTSGNLASETVSAAGVYSVIVLNTVTGCSVSAQYTISSNTTPPTAIVSNTVIPCGSPSVTLGASSSATNASYSWTTLGTGTILSGSATATPTVGSAGQYVVTITDNSNGCSTNDTVDVTTIGVTAAFTANPTSGTAPLLVNFTNQSTGASVYSWTFGDTNNNTSAATDPNHTYNANGIYVVTLVATDASGLCSATATISIEVFENSVLIVPNVFTPNSDGSNDVFKITSTGIKDLNCDIFNRWGQKVYTIKGINDSWDGGDAPDGTYFFILQATGYDGKEYKQQNFMSLFR